MRKLIAALLAGAALGVASPALAATGYVGTAYEWREVETPAGNSDSDGIAINGSVAFDVTESLGYYSASNLGVQLDGSYVFVDDENTAAVTGHLFTRNDDWLWGGYVALADTEDTNVWGVGAEANRYFDQYTVAGTVGWTWLDDIDTDIFGDGGEVRYFLSDSTRIDGGVGWARVDTLGGDDDALTFSIGGERQFTGSPVSAFANYTTAGFDQADVDTNSFQVGLRWNFAPTLIDRDRQGPSLNQTPLATRFAL